MTTPYLDHAAIQARLRAALPAAIRVGRAAELDALLKSRQSALQTPSVWIVPIRDRVEGQGGRGVGRMVHAEVGVLVAERDLSDDHGAGATDTLRALRMQVSDVLQGWPARTTDADLPGWAPLLRTGGQFVRVHDYVYEWLDRYATQAGG